MRWVFVYSVLIATAGQVQQEYQNLLISHSDTRKIGMVMLFSLDLDRLVRNQANAPTGQLLEYQEILRSHEGSSRVQASFGLKWSPAKFWS